MSIKHFSEQGKTVRTVLNLSQEELAHALCVGFAMVNRWENSKTTPLKMALTLFKKFCREENLNIPRVEL